VTTSDFLGTGSAPEGDSPSAVRFSPDGAQIVVAHRDSMNLTVFDAATQTVLRTIPLAGSPNSLALSPDNVHGVTANIFEDTASIVDLAGGEEIDVVPVGEQPGIVRITPDGLTAVVGNTVDETLSVIDIATATETTVLDGASFGGTTSFGSWAIAYGFTDFAITPDSNTVILPLPFADQIAFFDLAAESLETIDATEAPWGIALSDDGLIAAVSHGYPNTDVSVVDVPGRQITAVIPTGGGATTSPPIALDPDGTLAAVAVQNSVRLIDLVAETTSSDLTAGTPGSLHTTADGLHCFVGAWNAPLISYESQTVVGSFLDSTTPDYAAVSPTGPRAATAHILRKEMMEVINVDGAAGYLEAEVPTGDPPEGDKARRVAVTADGELAVVIHNHSHNAAIVDTASLEVLGYAPLGERPGEVALTPDGSRAVVSNLDDDFVSVVDLATYESTEITISRRGSQVRVSPDGAHAYVAVVADGDGVWRVDLDALAVDGAKLATGDLGGIAGGFDLTSGMALSHDGATLITCNSFSDSVSIVDTAAWSVVATVPVGAFPVRAAFSPDDAEIYVTNGDGGSVTVIDNLGADSAVQQTIPVGASPLTLAVHPYWPTLYVADYEGIALAVVDLVDGETSATIPLPTTNDAGQPIDLALDDSGSFLFAACSGADVHRIDTYELEIVETVNIEFAPAQLVYRDATGCAHVPSPFGDDGLALVCFCQ
jgi:YVTN family beta-propeller protein